MSKFEVIKQEWQKYFQVVSKTPGFQRLSSGAISADHYKSILRQIYFHTRENPQIQAVATAYFRGHQREMIKLFYQHAISEIGHDKLAMNDFECLGGKIEDFPAALPATQALISYPFYVIQYQNPLGYLGYLFHLEFMPTQNGRKYMDTLASIGIPEEAMTFIEEHSTVDIAHNKLMERYIQHLVVTEEDLETVIEAAKVTAKLYANFLQEAVEAADLHVCKQIGNLRTNQLFSELGAEAHRPLPSAAENTERPYQRG